MKKTFFHPLSVYFRRNHTLSSKAPKRTNLRFEQLEERQMLSINPLGVDDSLNETAPVYASSAHSATDQVEVSLILPESLSRNEEATILVTYTNTGTADIESPLLAVTV